VAIIITLVSALLFCPQAFSQQVTLKLAHTVAPTHPYNTLGVKLADLVKNKSGGSLVINLHPAGQLGGERDILEGLQVGTVDIAICSLGVAASFIPELNVLNLPFLFKDAKHFSEVTSGPIGKRLLKQAEQKKMVGLGFFGPVFRVPINGVRPIETPGDFKGLRIRLMEVPLHMDTYKAMGASPVPLPMGELYTALQLKTVDGAENAMATLYTERFYEVQKYVTALPVFSNGAILLMSQATWTKLSPKHREAIMESLPEALAQGDKDYLALEEKGLTVMKGAGIKVNIPATLAPFREAAKPVYAKYLEKMPGWVKESFEQIQK
jgi:tripartite ATP-independent transporter DctP family solute receptor